METVVVHISSRSAWLTFLSFHSSSLSLQCQSICIQSAGSWLEAGGRCFVILLLWSYLPHLAGGFKGASDGCAVSHLFPPWIREAVSPDLPFPLLAPAPFSLPRLSLACRHLSTALREAVPQPCPSVNPHYPRILDLAPPPRRPPLSSCLDAAPHYNATNLLSGLPMHRAGKRWGTIQSGEGWRGRIQILPLICSEKCPAQRTLTPINPATGCYRCSGRHRRCVYVSVCVCERGPGGAAGEGISVLSGGLRHRLNLSAHYPPRPGWGADKCTLGPQAKLIHLPSFSSGSEVAAARRQGEGALRWWETDTAEREGGERERVWDRVRWRREASGERGVPGFVPHPCLISLFSSSLSLSHFTALPTPPSLENAIKTCTHSPTKSQVGN